MSRKQVVILIVVIAIIAFLGLFALMIGIGTAIVRPGGHIYGKRVALIRVEGVITGGRGSSGFFGDGGAGSEHIVKLLEKFRKDDSTQSLVLRINSPGGSPAGSQEVYQEIIRTRKDGKHVLVSMGDVAASGGYYIASASDKIYADPATLTGSIGVIMETADIHALLNRVGVNLGAIKSGKYKDIGSPSRPMTPEERKLLQGIIDDTYDQFVTDVSTARKLPKPYVLGLADGRVFTGRQALKLKLVDNIGSLEDTFKAAAADAGIKGSYSVVEYEERRGFFDALFGDSSESLPSWLRQSAGLREFAQKLLKSDSHLEMR